MSPSESSGFERILGDVAGPEPGPLLIAVAGLHGNEPAGVHALRRVFTRLDPGRLRGRFVGIAGNLGALARRVRFDQVDLNRAWTAERLERLSSADPKTLGHEDREQRELMDALQERFADHPGPVYCIDLHTISASGAPFATLADTLRNRTFARHFPVPKLLGIEEQIDGSLLEWLGGFGFVTLGFEGGRHDAPESIDRHEAIAWLALEAAGLLDRAQIPDRRLWTDRLRQACKGTPSFVEVRLRHPVRPEDGFQMEPGWSHLQRVRAGTVLAHDVRGPVVASEGGYVLLPLYQGQGEDGFFLGRAVHPVWLGVSRILRASGLPSLAHWLPGVRRKADDPSTLVVDGRVARWESAGIFHLLGYRRMRQRGSLREFTRRLE